MLRPFIPACLAVLISTQALASISLSATRVVFDGAHKEANITVRNGRQDTLIQSWVDRDDDTGAATPFAVTPPLARIFAGEQQLLRILYEGQGMPDDRESVLWLNVQEIPQAAKTANTLQLAVRQRIKVFFRPRGLPGDALGAPGEVEWRLALANGKPQLTLHNPSRYHVSLADVTLKDGVFSERVIDSRMLAPGAEASVALRQFSSASKVALSFSCINDYGALSHYRATLSHGQPSTARLADAR